VLYAQKKSHACLTYLPTHKRDTIKGLE